MRCRLGTGLCSRGAWGGLGVNSHQLDGNLAPAGLWLALPRGYYCRLLEVACLLHQPLEAGLRPRLSRGR